MKEKVFLVWQDGVDQQFWNQYESLEDAVSDNQEVEIYEAIPKLLGKFKVVAQKLKVKKVKE